MKTVLSAVVVGLMLVVSEIGAQETARRRVGLGLTGAVTTLPDVFVSQCGVGNTGGGAGIAGAGALLFRPWNWIAMQADVSATLPTIKAGCVGLVSAVRIDYDHKDFIDPVFLSTARIGLETPPGLPLVRATIGAGYVLGGTQPPLTVWGFATGTRGQGKRLLIEWDRFRTRVNAAEVRSNGLVDTSSTPMVVRPRWSALRIGVELPLKR
ncbi:MAG TPA: hypothetical protein VGE27_12600 [Gemmatimonas sp.]|uniref:hypothetical protein n=1 Tax=Gemmatimonas sp. TaxID=1962908 RepID=UPI002EDB60E9